MKTKSLLSALIALLILANFCVAQISAPYYGLYTENSAITEFLEIVDDGASGGHIFIWNGFTGVSGDPAAGDTALILERDPGTWNGLGIQSDNPIDLSDFIDGYIKLTLKTNSVDEDFRLGVKDQDGNDWVVLFNVGADPYEFARDGEWHELAIPIGDFQPKDENTVELTAETFSNITVLLYLVGTVDISLDEIFYSQYVETPFATAYLSTLLSKDFIIYPNPAYNRFTISGINQDTQITILSPDGRVMEKLDTQVDIQIETSSFKPGVYFVQLNTSEGSTTKSFMIK